MGNNCLPVIPAQEYKQRWKKIQEMMEKNNYDLVIAYSNDRSVFGHAHARWLADYPVHFEPVCVLMFKSGEPIMVLVLKPKNILKGEVRYQKFMYLKNLRILKKSILLLI